MPKYFLLFLRLSFVLFPILTVSCASSTPIPATPVVLQVQFTASVQPWLEDLNTCAEGHDVVITNEERAGDYIDLNVVMAIRIGQSDHPTSFAYQVGSEEIVAIINAKNPIETLSTFDLLALFFGRVTNWREFGGRKLPVQVWTYASGEDLQQVFGVSVMHGTPVTGDARVAASPTEMATGVGSDPGAIGFLSKRLLTETVRSVVTVTTAPVLVIIPSEPDEVIQDLLTCLQDK